MIQIENTFFSLGESCARNCLIICDRGAMDASACKWNILKIRIGKLGIGNVIGCYNDFRYYLFSATSLALEGAANQLLSN